MRPPIAGTVSYEDASPAAGASVAITDLKSGTQIAVVSADHDGEFQALIAPGDYALAITADHGAAWIEKLTVAGDSIAIKLDKLCSRVNGSVNTPRSAGAQVTFDRHGFNSGDTFVTQVQSDGGFALCLPPAEYTVHLKGHTLSTGIGIKVPCSESVLLHGHPASEVKSAPRPSEEFSHNIDGLVADIARSGARLVGLGEATHGSAEFVTERSRLVFELARRAQLRLVLLESDAILTMALDRYVNGDNVDLPKAVAALGFWITDTYEFLRFIDEIRTYNLASASTAAKIHLAGIDAQNTEPPVALLVANSLALHLSADEIALLQSISVARGKAVKDFSPARRAVLDQLLSRLSTPNGGGIADTQIAAAGRSLAIQVGYMDGEIAGAYAARRDEGMAQLASFFVARSVAKLACLWAHADHVSRMSESSQSMGQRLSTIFQNQYYAVGFYMFEGSSRAWDFAGKIGVISHTLGPAPGFTLEGALMAAAGSPDVAWLPFSRLPDSLRSWLETPRFVREMGAVYFGEARAMILLDARVAFDALVVVKRVHASSPTPTGARQATND